MLLALLLASLAVAGCSSPSSSTSSSSTDTSGSMAGMHMAKTWEVALQGNKFVNDTLTIHVGDTVKWTNKDSVGHSVTSRTGQTESFDSNPQCQVALEPSPICMPNGGSFSYTFKKAGTTEYYCRAHSMMTAKVVVLEHSQMAGMAMSSSSHSMAPASAA